MSTTIVLVDLSSIAHQLFHVTANDPNPDATSIKTVERVRALASGQPHVAVCMDGPPYFRKDIDPAYKAQRDKENNAVIGHQIALAADALRADGFPVWQVTGFEADDLLATATAEALAANVMEPRGNDPLDVVPSRVSVTVCSSDKDLLQLVSDRVTFKSLTSGNNLDEAAVVAKFGVRPSQMRDYLTLVGDTSDNVQGCKGVGPKKAAELLAKCGNLEGIYGLLNAHGTQFTPALATNLREFESRMPTVRELVTLRTDVPLPFEEVFRERVPQDVASFGGEEPMDDGQQATEDMRAAMHEATKPFSEPAPPMPFTPPTDPMRELAKAAEVVSSGAPPRATEAVAVRQPATPAAIIADFNISDGPQTYAQAKLMAADLFAAKLFQGYGSAPAVLATIMVGKELGLVAGVSLRGIHIIDSKQAFSADLIRSLCLRSRVCEYFRIVERSAEKATWITKRHGDPEVSLTFTLDEGRLAWSKGDKAWDDSGWGKRPVNMVTKTASSQLARLVYPDLVLGMYWTGELSGEDRE